MALVGENTGASSGAEGSAASPAAALVQEAFAIYGLDLEHAAAWYDTDPVDGELVAPAGDFDAEDYVVPQGGYGVALGGGLVEIGWL